MGIRTLRVFVRSMRTTRTTRTAVLIATHRRATGIISSSEIVLLGRQGAKGESLLPFSLKEKFMHSLYLAVVMTVLLPGLVMAQSVKQKAVIEQEIKRLDVAHADAILRGDLVALDKLWT